MLADIAGDTVVPWTLRNTIVIPESEFAVYRRFNFADRSTGVAWAVELETAGDTVRQRLRTGFLYTGAVVAGRELIGASEELARGDDVGNRALFYLDWRWLDALGIPSVDVASYFARVAPDRGCLPATVRLWRYA